MQKKYFLMASFLVLSVGCEKFTPEAVDVDTEKAAVLAADQAWSNTVGDLDTFMSFFAEDARFLPPDGPQATGRDEIRQSFSALAALPGFSLTWSANFSDVSGGGDLGYSVGTFEMIVDGPGGSPAARTGTYTTVWKKQNDGQWKVVSDIPNFDSPAGSMDVASGKVRSLYQRLGGYDALVAINDAIGARVVDDPDFDQLLAGVDEESGQRGRQLAILRFCEAAGGDCTYVGRDLKTVHAGMGISDENWQSFMGHLKEALNELNVAEAEQVEIIGIFSELEDEIVDSTQ